MKFAFTDNTLDNISTDALILFAFQEEKNKKPPYTALHSFHDVDKKLRGKLKHIADLEKFTGKKGEVISYVTHGEFLASRVFVVGLGKKSEFVGDNLRRAMGLFAKRTKGKLDSLVVVFPTDEELDIDKELAAMLVYEGLNLATHEFMQYKKKEENQRELSSLIFTEQSKENQEKITKGIERGELYVQATIVARDLINETPTIATPTYLANFAKEIAKAHSEVTCKVYDKPQLEKMGMHAFLGIARAADTPPKFIHLEYNPKSAKGKEKLAIIGKGITFDSGGISLKPPDYMMDMKCDMSGAALVLAVFTVIAEIKPSFPVIGLIAATPNLISGSAIVPGDVVRAMNGKTIEVLNTDAEGRVTMADSLSYAVREKATRIIDFATLTGACVVALGHDIAGLFSNNRDLAEDIKSAAYSAGEKVWEMPLEKEYKALNKSDIADVANISPGRYGGAITAGLFLEEFVSDTPWAHVDIAGPAFLSKPSDIGPKGGAGFGVRTVLNLLTAEKEKLK